MSNAAQCRKVPEGASGSSTTRTRLPVPAGTSDHDKGGEAETSAALHDLRHAIDVHEAVDELAVALFAIAIAAAAAFSFTRHLVHPLIE